MKVLRSARGENRSKLASEGRILCATHNKMKATLYTVLAAVTVLTTNAHAIADPVNVPDGGLTVSMLSIAVGGLFVVHRKMK